MIPSLSASKIVQRWQAVVFDMDDTLYPEQAYVLSGFRAVAAWAATAIGVDAATGYAKFQALFNNGVRGDTFNQWLSHFNQLEPHATATEISAAVAPLIEVYRHHTPTLQPFPEAAALLPVLARHYQLGLVSDGYLAVQQRKWAALKVATYFCGVVFSDQWGRAAWKPSTTPFLEVLRLLHVEPAQALYIGDNPLKDFLGAKQVGMATIWLKHGAGEYSAQAPPTAAHQPDYTVTSWAALHSMLLADKS